jgi:hypothetical protein
LYASFESSAARTVDNLLIHLLSAVPMPNQLSQSYEESGALQSAPFLAQALGVYLLKPAGIFRSVMQGMLQSLYPHTVADLCSMQGWFVPLPL